MPPGEDRERRICNTCAFIDYANPRIVTGVVAHRNGRILLCRRAIDPRMGFWTLPAGFLELGESVEEGAKRES
ncbi:MAG: NUDIX domain-containing protein, partial [Burkholderiales bacterium]